MTPPRARPKVSRGFVGRKNSDPAQGATEGLPWIVGRGPAESAQGATEGLQLSHSLIED